MDPVIADPRTGSNFNRYNYGNNNPYSFVDPDGRYSCAAEKKADCAAVADYAKAVRQAADNPPRNTSTAQAIQLTAIANYIGTEGDGSGPAITIGEHPDQKMASSDQNGNWIVDVSKAQSSASPLAKGAMALGHEAKHDLDKIARGVANTEGVVRERETAAYRIQAVIGRSAGFVMKQKDIQAGIEGSVLTWKEREEIRLNKASGGSQ